MHQKECKLIRTDSRKVQKGDTFVALPGISSNGDQYIAKAIEAGAVKVVCRKNPDSRAGHPAYDLSCGRPVSDNSAAGGPAGITGTGHKASGKLDTVEYIYTEDPRSYLEKLLVSEYGDIIQKMTIIAVTGTNGKTTTCYLLSQALNLLGRKCAYIGTIGFFMGGKVRDLPNTSVDICDLYGLLIEAHEAGYDAVALEASSQGIDMGRLNTLEFDIAAFTNLTEDHLDYHKTMENYALAKQRLFKMLKDNGKALVNSDDEYKDYFMVNPGRTWTYGIRSGDFQVTGYRFDKGTGITYRCSLPEGGFAKENNIKTALFGIYNIYNTMAVVGTLALLGYDQGSIGDVMGKLKPPSGRFDVIAYKDCNIVVDYAHTPDAVINVISTAKEFTKGSIITVFGCTGDREREKRPVMTQLVLNNCKYAIITDDDVHSEPEQRIVDDMLEGNTLTNYEVCLDRKAAIHKGIDMLEPGDTLLVLGKGHEEFIIMDGYRIPHNDRKAVLEYIKPMGESL